MMQKIFKIENIPKHRINYNGNIIPHHYITLWTRLYAYEMGVPEWFVKYDIDTEEWGELPQWTPPK